MAVGQELVVQTNGGRCFEPVFSRKKTGEHRHHRREMSAIGQAIDRSRITRQHHEPRAAAELSLDRFPQPDLKRQHGFVVGKRRLNGAETGERGARAVAVREAHGDLALCLPLFQLQPFQLLRGSSASRRCRSSDPSAGAAPRQWPPGACACSRRRDVRAPRRSATVPACRAAPAPACAR